MIAVVTSIGLDRADDSWIGLVEKEALPAIAEEANAAAPRVSVVIPCNDDRHLPATLASLAGQKDAPPFEVILVDATGTDLRRHLEPGSDPSDVRVVKARPDGSGPANRNMGVAASAGAFLLFLDADDTVNETYVRAMAQALETHELVCCSVDMLLLNPWNPGGTHPQQTGLITEEMSFLPFAGAGTLGIRRSLFERIGGWDASLLFYAEADLCWRIQLAGYGPPAFVPGAILHYRLDPTPGGRWGRAVGLGRTQPLLYRRFRHVGMRRERLREVLRAWWELFWDLVRMTLGQHTGGILWRTAVRVGRLQGSLRYRVPYL